MPIRMRNERGTECNNKKPEATTFHVPTQGHKEQDASVVAHLQQAIGRDPKRGRKGSQENVFDLRPEGWDTQAQSMARKRDADYTGREEG